MHGRKYATRTLIEKIWKGVINMAVKKTEKKSVQKKSGTSKGSKYTCDECGIVVSVDEACGCVDVCDLVCCGEPMKQK